MSRDRRRLGALVELRRGHALMPDNASVRYMLDACVQPDGVPRAPDEYLAEHFDRFESDRTANLDTGSPHRVGSPTPAITS